MKISNLLNKEFNFVGKKKIFFLVPLIIVVIAAVCMLIYGLTLGSPVNLGMDFTGGYSVDITLGTKLNDSNYNDYQTQIVNIIENLKDENDQPYGLKVGNIQRQGTGDQASIHITYNAVADEVTMDEVINDKMREALQDAIFKIIPAVKVDGNNVVLDYGGQIIAVDSTFNAIKTALGHTLSDSGITYTSIERNSENTALTIACGSSSAITDEIQNKLKQAGSIDDSKSGLVSEGSAVSASFSTELLLSALAAILGSVVLMLIYIAFRFELLSGLSAILALLHDLVIMFSVMVIFHVEINSTFIAALITILGYSINNTIVIFDRIRENQKTMFAGGSSAMFIANKSINETLMRSINTTLTTLLTIGMVAVLGVTSIKIFALPIIIGLLAGTYSSIFISPAIWAGWKDRKKKGPQQQSGNKELKKAAAAE